MPQTLTEWWEHHLGDDFGATHELLLHTIGNLTLTGYNSELSNADFPAKRRRFEESHVSLNTWFQDQTQWNETAIRKRAEALAERALAVWKYFGKPDDEPRAAPVVGVRAKDRPGIQPPSSGRGLQAGGARASLGQSSFER